MVVIDNIQTKNSLNITLITIDSLGIYVIKRQLRNYTINYVSKLQISSEILAY
jgi:hypothetical protein